MPSLLRWVLLVPIGLVLVTIVVIEVDGHPKCGWTRLEEPDDHHKQHEWHKANPKHINGCKFSPLPHNTMLWVTPQKYNCYSANNICDKPHYWGAGSAKLGALTFWLKSHTFWGIDKLYVLRKKNCEEKKPKEGMLGEEATKCIKIWRSTKTLSPEYRIKWNDRIMVTSQ